MIPQGTGPLNLEYFTALKSRISSSKSCSELQSVASEAAASLGALQTALVAQIAIVEPMLALLEAPTSPTAAVTWITTFITAYLTPQLVAATSMAAKQAALTTQTAGVSAAASSKAGDFPGCSV